MILTAGGLLAMGSGACRGALSPPGPWHEEGAYRWREVAGVRAGPAGFSRMSPRRTGIRFANTASPALTRENRHLTHGSGVALGDVDGDGLVDIYLNRIEGPNALYRNLGDWRFEEVARARGVDAPGRFSTGVVLADVDGDADLDLLLTALGGPNTLYRNDGTGRFRDATARSGLRSGLGSTTMALADVEGDGDLDLYVTNYKVLNVQDAFPPSQRTFDQVVRKTGSGYTVAPEFRQHYRVRVIPEYDIVVRIQRADPDWFYVNDGAGRFTLVPLTAGRFLDGDGQALAEAPDRFGLAARFYDVDGDRDPDLYVCNDFEDPDEFWINDGTGTFRAAPAHALRTASNAAMAVDFSDIDRDGHVDFFVVDMLGRDPVRRQTQTATHTPLPKLPGRIFDRPQRQRNTLFRNRGDGTFAEIAAFAGVEASGWSWSTLFLDVDLDGYEDVLVATGHVWDVMDADTQEALRALRLGGNWRDERFRFPRLALPNGAFRNEGDWTFQDRGAAWGFGDEADISHGMAAGDLDGDGDLDVVVNRWEAPAAVLRNNAGSARVAVRLAGDPPNTQGIGAKIRVLGGAVPQQEKEVTLGGLYLSSSDPMYTFAAGASDTLSIVVEWRSGARSVVTGARPNRLYEIRETAAARAADPASTPEPSLPYFTDVTAQLGHRHVETPFDDFRRQPLLPHSLSRLGPGVAWYDVDSDGYEELIVSSGRGGALGIHRNRHGRLARSDRRLAPAPLDQSAVLGMPAGEGSAALLVGQSGYEARRLGAARAAPAVLRLRLGADGRDTELAAAVGGDSASTGPLALADYDGDGDLDLFVGGRVIPGAYPMPATSRLFRNQGGRFELDTANAAVLRSVGLVSAAVFSDIDGDGDPDLVLALDLGPLTLFRNAGGRFQDRGRAAGLSPHIGRWNGVTTGDLDGDGRLDIVATNWGRNTKYRLAPDAPLLVYSGDFDRNGSVDVVEAQRDDERGGVFPLEPWGRMARAIPATRQRVRSHAAYAAATVEEIIGDGLRGGRRVAVMTLDHMVLLNRGERFEPVALPAEAQLAPAFYAGIADFNGDGHEDLFLSQNFFPTDIGTRRYDAGRGLWLEGDGTGALHPVPGHVSGVRVYGDQRGAALADYNGDGRVDLAVSQNGAETKLYRNDRARPGLRVRVIGPPGNPNGVGATMRLVYRDGRGPAREIHAGSGYWSQDGAIQVLGQREQPVAVWVRWPGGDSTETPVPPGIRDVTVRRARWTGGRQHE
ncbi:MAG: FG-GAP repeat domain-containing protein [Gemmatimonadales bacterium]